MKIQRQPGQPNQFRLSNRPEIGSPKTVATGIAAMKLAIALARSAARNQSDKYKMTDGKKPPSKKPNMNR